MPSPYDADHFPIRELSRLTGVHTSTLRAWENRHGLLTPRRTASGHRLYHHDDVLRVRRLRELLAQGFSLAEIRDLLPEPELPEPPTTTTVSVAPAWQGYVHESLRALEDFSGERLDALYNEACALYPIDLVTRNLLVPLLELLGQRWDKRPSGIAEEHFFSAWLRNKLGARLHHSQGARRGRPLVVACLPGEHHEIGLLLFCLAALDLGYRIIYLGADMPTRQIAPVARQTGALGIVLAARSTDRESALLDDLTWLQRHTGLPVMLGSHVARQLADALPAVGLLGLGEDIESGLRRLEAHLAAFRRAETGAEARRPD
ncbi:MAG: MerR family transcriptional regulator [Pseudomonadota bacterium]